MIFMIIVFIFPAIPGPTSQNMNYTLVVIGGTMILSLAYYYFPIYGGAKWFNGPVANINEHDDYHTDCKIGGEGDVEKAE
jgi:hypothetical protein